MNSISYLKLNERWHYIISKHILSLYMECDSDYK